MTVFCVAVATAVFWQKLAVVVSKNFDLFSVNANHKHLIQLIFILQIDLSFFILMF